MCLYSFGTLLTAILQRGSSVQMDAYDGLNPKTGSFTRVHLDDYQERVSYDPNGNILIYDRHGDAAR